MARDTWIAWGAEVVRSCVAVATVPPAAAMKRVCVCVCVCVCGGGGGVVGFIVWRGWAGSGVGGKGGGITVRGATQEGTEDCVDGSDTGCQLGRKRGWVGS